MFPCRVGADQEVFKGRERLAIEPSLSEAGDPAAEARSGS
jgi:hypothetical protein